MILRACCGVFLGTIFFKLCEGNWQAALFYAVPVLLCIATEHVAPEKKKGRK